MPEEVIAYRSTMVMLCEKVERDNLSPPDGSSGENRKDLSREESADM